VLAAIGITTMVWLRQPRKPILQEPRLIKSYGWAPTLSRDGKLLAYCSSVGGGQQHIWVQQTAGGEAIQVTTGPDAETAPDFSPDGAHIAFYSKRRGGGIYIASTLPGEPRLVVSAGLAESPRFSPGGDAASTVDVFGSLWLAYSPRFSPDGDSILYWQALKLFTVSVNGGRPNALALNQDFRVYSPPIWAPNGK
jgi:Tol biopolymer transport system component